MAVILTYLAWVVGLLALQAESSVALNPGFRTIITQKGLDYVHHIGLPILEEKLHNLTIPPITGKGGGFEYTIDNLVILSFKLGNSSLTSDVKGVVLTVIDIFLSISADWSYREEIWPHVKGHGAIDVTASGASLSLSVDIKANKTNGRMWIKCSSCSFDVGDLHIEFHGGASWLYNLFKGIIEDILRKKINEKVCVTIPEKINTLGSKLADSFPVGKLFEIDYALVTDPDFSHKGRIVTNHKGEFLLRAHPKDPPFVPPPLPDPSVDIFNRSKMLSVIATTYVAESASYVFWKGGLLAYNISDQIPSEYNTTSTYCAIDLVSKELCKKYPNKGVMFGIAASDYPRLNITEGYAAMSAEASLSMYVDNNGREELAFVLALNMRADVKPFLKGDSSTGLYTVGATVCNPRVEVHLAKTNIGQFNCSKLRELIAVLTPSIGLPYINKYTNAGFPIPVVDGVSLTSPVLKLGKGYVEIGTDVQYSEEHLKKLQSIVL